MPKPSEKNKLEQEQYKDDAGYLPPLTSHSAHNRLIDSHMSKKIITPVDLLPDSLSSVIDGMDTIGGIIKEVGPLDNFRSITDNHWNVKVGFEALNQPFSAIESITNRSSLFPNELSKKKLFGEAFSIIGGDSNVIKIDDPLCSLLNTSWGPGDESFSIFEVGELPFQLARESIIAANREFTSFMDAFENKEYSYETHKSSINEEQPSLYLRRHNDKMPVEQLKRAFGLNTLLEISEKEMVDFVGRLQRLPMLALEHRVGKHILNSIDEMSEMTDIKGLTVYRCRTRSPEEMSWSEFEMWEAPSGVSSQGRFNAEGRGFLYLSEDPEVSVAEMKQTTVTTYDIMELECSAKFKVIDLTKHPDLNLFRYCMFESKSKNKREYLVPNFLAQCCELKGIKAIKYKSIYKQDSPNYVFFDYLTDWFKYAGTCSVKK
ncbi:RES family NAD+ phosphorylase [Paenibacillus sp. LS1]|uniref:RES family NAD+ phosphorylase n=1 Tax=Paenibacillus sp. LS1 TaxID=2992120 RepID=UPI00222FBCD2|nr:RES family NAD+ phosphorylase [Paenibacillus sp. LS1]MCW3793779.1 RES family NAD+ phosphorylase [Paenibacillus sp. LS1]